MTATADHRPFIRLQMDTCHLWWCWSSPGTNLRTTLQEGLKAQVLLFVEVSVKGSFLQRWWQKLMCLTWGIPQNDQVIDVLGNMMITVTSGLGVNWDTPFLNKPISVPTRDSEPSGVRWVAPALCCWAWGPSPTQSQWEPHQIVSQLAMRERCTCRSQAQFVLPKSDHFGNKVRMFTNLMVIWCGYSGIEHHGDDGDKQPCLKSIRLPQKWEFAPNIWQS